MDNQSIEQYQLLALIETEDEQLASIGLLTIRALHEYHPAQATQQISMAFISMFDLGAPSMAALAIMAQVLTEEQLPVALRQDPALSRVWLETRRLWTLNTAKANIQSENFMRFLLLLSEDLQALLAVKAMKLWQLRHADHLQVTVLSRLIDELEHLYLPLAHRLGLYSIKSEMEEFVMRQRSPEIYQRIASALKENELERQRYIESFIAPVRATLQQHNIQADIKYRVKTIASIWRKMQAQRVGVEEVADVFAIRIIDRGPEESGKRRCWEIYSLVTDLYQPDPSRLRDWISVPRPSGYESLHTTVTGPDHKAVEVQIRTTRMDREAEEGPAAHWRYKEGQRKGSGSWLSRARALLGTAHHDPRAPGQAAQDKTPDAQEIFTMTPTGDLIRLKSGATVLDFAFDIHTNIGLRCKGGMVNGKIMPIRHVLNNGDTVDIFTAAQPNVSEDWLRIVVSGKARNNIRKALQKKQERAVAEGREILQRKLKQWKAGTLDDHIIHLMQHFKIKDVAWLYRQIAEEKINMSQLRGAVDAQQQSTSHVVKPVEKLTASAPKIREIPDDILVINEEFEATGFQMAKCCMPVFGDPVFGFVTVGKGIRIHRQGCPNASDMQTRYPYRVIPARWSDRSAQEGVHVLIQIAGKDKLGLVNAITDIISNDQRAMMRSVQFTTEYGKFKGEIRVFAKSQDHVGWILRKIRNVAGVEKATAKDL
jgi:GTP diphosphokinase / guanosine-3',5'-bis(diphosphate) 3'-diphosphatase